VTHARAALRRTYASGDVARQMHKRAAHASRGETMSENVEQKPECELPHGRVLIVDDDKTMGATIGRLLKPLEATFAQSAVGALARIQAGARFNAVVCDLSMPGMNGIQFHGEVAKIAPDLAQRMVFVTGSAITADVSAFLKRTKCLWLEKPFEWDRLRSSIATAVHR
jgi:CheY-like chemotaxis protein